MEDYEKNYEEFWKGIVENKDGTLNKDQVMRELADYYMVMDNCERAYDLMSDSRISKPNTKFFEVEAIFNDTYYHKRWLKEDLLDQLDEIDVYGNDGETELVSLDDVKNLIKDFLN